MEILGLDIGGSGIKAAPVNIETGELTGERFRLKTPQPATPDSMVETAVEVIRNFDWKGPIGCGFPGLIKNGIFQFAGNLDTKSWMGKDVAKLFSKASGCPVTLVNDADAAGLAEVKFGGGRGHEGVMMVLTLGTGIGSAIFIDGKMLPNTELGQVRMEDGTIAEKMASEAAKKRDDMKWSEYAENLTQYLQHLELLFSPDLFILGGGASKKFEKFAPHLDVKTEVVPAELRNLAGIIGAALAAAPENK